MSEGATALLFIGYGALIVVWYRIMGIVKMNKRGLLVGIGALLGLVFYRLLFFG